MPETKKQKLLDLADDINRAEKVQLWDNLDDRFPDSATLNKELKELLEEALRGYANAQ